MLQKGLERDFTKRGFQMVFNRLLERTPTITNV
jgi:hypothetical protein